MPHPPGARFGPYEVVAAIGSGGMGEVYKARDTRLERTVALKVSRESFGERFRNEALAVAALNHPHICTLHDVGPDYLVMEYVEGKPLQGPLPVAQTVRLAGEIADALDHAHQHGIVHRDLKPANILVTKSGIKVLDFGLAKRQPSEPSAESLPTLTEEGAVLGTPRYMAPEQINGKAADARTDVFAFGLVLYETLTGKRAFDGPSGASAMAAILERDPSPIRALRPDTPPALEQVVMTCLAKDPDERWQSVRELKHALTWASRVPATPPGGSRAGWIAATAVTVAVAGGLALARARRPAESPRPVSFDVALPQGVSVFSGQIPAVSPQGDRIVFVASAPNGLPHLYLRTLHPAATTLVPGTEGAFSPFWSPDGSAIGFVAQYRLKKVAVTGGPAEVLSSVELGGVRGATWGRDGTILFAHWSGQLWSVSAGGGEPRKAARLLDGEQGRFWPRFLPDGRRYLYWSQPQRPENRGIYVGSLGSDERTRILDADPNAVYSPSGHLLFVRGDALMAQTFDVSGLRLSGEPFRVTERVSQVSLPGAPGLSFLLAPAYSVSENGVLVWLTGSAPEGMELVWHDRSGRRLGTVGEPADYTNPALSPDGRTVVVGRRDPRTGMRDLWVFDATGGAGKRLTFGPADDFGPTWSPDGRWIAFTSDRGGVREIYRKLANGSGDDELLLPSSTGPAHVMDWRADGRFLLYNYWPAGVPMDLFLLPLQGGVASEPIPFVASEPQEDRGQFDPSGRFIAYDSNETGQFEVYVQAINADGTRGAGKWQVSTGGGLEPHWRRDGRELFYVSYATADRLMAVDVRTSGASFEAGTPRPLFDVRLPPEPRRNRFVVAPDGRRFLVNTAISRTSDEPIHVLVNWLSARP